MKVAIVKPDHVGDLVLSSPAIRAIIDRFPQAVLFVASSNRELARFLFGEDVDIRVLDLPHLSKKGLDRATPIRYRDFEIVVFLRRDNILSPERVGPLCNDYIFYTGDHNFHQTILDYTAASWLVGDYDIDSSFFRERFVGTRRKTLSAPRAVGLCVGAGYFANCWPIAYWVQLGKQLLRSGHTIKIISGPAEKEVSEVIATALGLTLNSLICGGNDFNALLGEIENLDWVIAADGGAAHLCSLVTPIISIFGGSPFRRYAPFGRWNRLVTLELACSPCSQYASRSVNGCLSNECVVDIGPHVIQAALAMPFKPIDHPYVTQMSDGCKLYFGTSHFDREAPSPVSGVAI